MPISTDTERRLHDFLHAHPFADAGAVITDLDGTAVHQVRDRYMIPEGVERGLERVRACSRPTVVNTLRFPLSIMRTFGGEWAERANPPLPCITLNGSLIGDIAVEEDGTLGFRERAAFPLSDSERDVFFSSLEKALAAGLQRIILFIYPRSWGDGEIIWTPDSGRVSEISARFVSASVVLAGSLATLHERLAGRDICMMTVLTDDPGDTRLAFQHGHKSNFLTTADVSKRSGTRWLADQMGFDLAASIGAGDTEMDTFLDAVGLSLHVGNNALAYRGGSDTLKLADPLEFGDVLFHVAVHCERTRK